MEPFDTKGEKTGMINYIYKLVWNEQNQMLFEITNGKTVISLLYLEDINRPGELMRDFPYLYPTYYASEEEWDDDRNMVLACNYVHSILIWKSTEEKFEKVREDLYYIAESMIENRGNIRVKFDMKYDQEVITMYEENKAKEQLMAALKAKN